MRERKRERERERERMRKCVKQRDRASHVQYFQVRARLDVKLPDGIEIPDLVSISETVSYNADHFRLRKITSDVYDSRCSDEIADHDFDDSNDDCCDDFPLMVFDDEDNTPSVPFLLDSRATTHLMFSRSLYLWKYSGLWLCRFHAQALG